MGLFKGKAESEIMEEKLYKFFENKSLIDELEIANAAIQQEFEDYAKKNSSEWNGQTYTLGDFKLSYTVSNNEDIIDDGFLKLKKLLADYPDAMTLKPNKAAVKKIFNTPKMVEQLLKRYGVQIVAKEEKKYSVSRKY